MKRATAYVVALLIAVNMIGLALFIGHSRTKVDQTAAFTRAVCVEANKQRDGERGLWTLIFSITAQDATPRTSAQKRQAAKALHRIQAYLNTTFAHIDCDVPTPPVPSPSGIAFPRVTRVVTDVKTKTRTIFITVAGPTRTVVRTVIVCQRPNGRPC